MLWRMGRAHHAWAVALLDATTAAAGQARPTAMMSGWTSSAGRKTNGPAAWTRFSHPAFWHYDVLRGLDYLRAVGVTPDDRVAEAIDGEGEPSRCNTLRATRVLRWCERQTPPGQPLRTRTSRAQPSTPVAESDAPTGLDSGDPRCLR